MLSLNIRRNKLILAGCFFLLLAGCKKQASWTIYVKNHSNFVRDNETVKVPLSLLNLQNEEYTQSFIVKDVENGNSQPVQLIDSNNDGRDDALIFQVNIDSLAHKKYQLVTAKSKNVVSDSIVAYSRFVPERVGDYAWENDRVAFRMYGPEAQNLALEDNPDGIVSSGIDCWFKRVKYPVINEWYKKFTDKTGSYHVDTGEGLDAYSVGSSRGCGGIGVWENDTLFVSQNFTNYKTIENGPIRTNFELDYGQWETTSLKIKERKKISLDLGSNLSRIELVFEPPYPKVIVAGLACSKDAVINEEAKDGYFSCMEKLDSTEVYYGIVAEQKYIVATLPDAPKRIDGHLPVYLHPVDGKLVYYSGFGWTKSGQYNSLSEWNNYLYNFSLKLTYPLQVEFGD